VQPLEAASVVLASGVRIFDTNGPLRIPKLVSGAAVGFVAESAQIPEADVDFGEVSLMPSTLKSLKVLIRFSNELLRQSVIGLDATLKTRLGHRSSTGNRCERHRNGMPATRSSYGTPRPARSYRPDLVGRLPRPGSSRTVPVPSHCRQSSTLIPMRSSAGQSAVALRGTHMVASRS
jgi:hypothetical protein